jgi:hypothetical protein
MLGGNIDKELMAAVAPSVVVKNFLLEASIVIGCSVWSLQETAALPASWRTMRRAGSRGGRGGRRGGGGRRRIVRVVAAAGRERERQR